MVKKSIHITTNYNKNKKKEFKPIYSDDFYSYQIDLTFLNKYKNSNDGIYVLFTAINKIAVMLMHIMVKIKKHQQN